MFNINETQIEESFRTIANTLLLEKALQVNDALFRFTEIEFYYYCDSHPDGFTHQHALEAGRWRFHNQGFDITLRGNTGYGGMLIRGIHHLDAKEQKYINGPRRVLFKISEYLAPVNDLQNTLGLVEATKLNFDIFETFRHGLGKPQGTCDDPQYYIDKHYRFMVEPQQFNKKEFSGAEKIARQLKDPKLKEKFLGYNLKS